MSEVFGEVDVVHEFLREERKSRCSVLGEFGIEQVIWCCFIYSTDDYKSEIISYYENTICYIIDL